MKRPTNKTKPVTPLTSTTKLDLAGVRGGGDYASEPEQVSLPPDYRRKINVVTEEMLTER